MRQILNTNLAFSNSLVLWYISRAYIESDFNAKSGVYIEHNLRNARKKVRNKRSERKKSARQTQLLRNGQNANRLLRLSAASIALRPLLCVRCIRCVGWKLHLRQLQVLSEIRQLLTTVI